MLNNVRIYRIDTRELPEQSTGCFGKQRVKLRIVFMLALMVEVLPLILVILTFLWNYLVMFIINMIDIKVMDNHVCCRP